MSDKIQKDGAIEDQIKNLISQLGNPDESERKKAMDSLSAIESPDAAKCLAGYMTHKDNLVRYSVRKALNEIKARKGTEFDDELIENTLPAGKERSDIKAGRVITFLIILISVTAGSVYHFYFKPGEQTAASTNRYTLSLQAGPAAKNNEDYNIIRQDEKGAPVLKVKGLVSQSNKIKRELKVLFGAQGDCSIVSFPENVKMDAESGDNVEIDGELIKNDNIGPLLIKCRKIKILRK